MKRINLELYSKKGKLAIYIIRFEGEDVNETDAFLQKHFELGFIEDIQIIKRWIENLENRGAREEYFRPEKRARAGPKSASKLRIYCIRCHENLIILDGGGIKKGQYAQSGEDTNYSFELMNAIDAKFVEKLSDRDINYSNDSMGLEGELFVDI